MGCFCIPGGHATLRKVKEEWMESSVPICKSHAALLDCPPALHWNQQILAYLEINAKRLFLLTLRDQGKITK